jgi:hypothetical protein
MAGGGDDVAWCKQRMVPRPTIDMFVCACVYFQAVSWPTGTHPPAHAMRAAGVCPEVCLEELALARCAPRCINCDARAHLLFIRLILAFLRQSCRSGECHWIEQPHMPCIAQSYNVIIMPRLADGCLPHALGPGRAGYPGPVRQRSVMPLQCTCMDDVYACMLVFRALL